MVRCEPGSRPTLAKRWTSRSAQRLQLPAHHGSRDAVHPTARLRLSAYREHELHSTSQSGVDPVWAQRFDFGCASHSWWRFFPICVHSQRRRDVCLARFVPARAGPVGSLLSWLLRFFDNSRCCNCSYNKDSAVTTIGASGPLGSAGTLSAVMTSTGSSTLTASFKF